MARLRWLNAVYSDKVMKEIRERGGEAVVNYVTGADGGSHFWRDELDRYLETASRHHAMDSELQARLTSPHFETFRQAVAEIKTAWFIERKTPATPSWCSRATFESRCPLVYRAVWFKRYSENRELPHAGPCASQVAGGLTCGEDIALSGHRR